MSDYKNPRPSPSARASDPCVVYDNSVSFDKLINESEVVTTYKGVELQSVPSLLDQIESQASVVIQSIGWDPVGEFATGFTYTKLNDVGRDSSGSWWRYNGSDLPKVITAGTVPSSPNFSVISFETADNVEWEIGKSVGYSLDDLQGFTDELYAQAGIVDSGLPDVLGNSQRVDAMRQMFTSAGTVADIAAGKFKVGARVSVTDRDGAVFEIVSGGFANGFYILNAGGMNTAVYQVGTEINAKNLGCKLDGVTDDALPWSAAMKLAVETGVKLAGSGTLRLDNLSIVTMANGSSITIDLTNIPVIYGGNDTSLWERMYIASGSSYNDEFFGLDNCSITIINHDGEGVDSVAREDWGIPDTGAVRKNIPLKLHANNVRFIGKNKMRNVWGKPYNISNYNRVDLGQFEVLNCGGHSPGYTTDAFGDAVYFAANYADAQVEINLVQAIGMLAPSPVGLVSKGLSRIGIGFENPPVTGTSGIGSILCNIYGGVIANYERTTHCEETPNTIINWFNGGEARNTACLHSHYDSGGIDTDVKLNAYDLKYYQKKDLSFGTGIGARFGLGDQAIFNLFGGSFYDLSAPWGGVLENVPSGAVVHAFGSNFFCDNTRFHGQLDGPTDWTLFDCNIFDFSAEQQNSSFVVEFNNCNFRTTQPATYGVTISPVGIDIFNGCSLSNQTISQNCRANDITYFTDYGVVKSNGIYLDATTDKFPKLPKCKYTFFLNDNTLGTAEKYVVIWANGSIQDPGGLVVDNGDGTLSPSGSLPLHSLLTITMFS